MLHCLSVYVRWRECYGEKQSRFEGELEVMMVLWDFKSSGQGRPHWETDIGAKTWVKAMEDISVGF